MTRAELIVTVPDRTNLDRKSAEKAVAATFEAIKEALVNGDKVQVLGFGTFENRTRAARKGRNPRTGEEIEIKSSNQKSQRGLQSLRKFSAESGICSALFLFRN